MLEKSAELSRMGQDREGGPRQRMEANTVRKSWRESPGRADYGGTRSVLTPAVWKQPDAAWYLATWL